MVNVAAGIKSFGGKNGRKFAVVIIKLGTDCCVRSRHWLGHEPRHDIFVFVVAVAYWYNDNDVVGLLLFRM